MTQPDLDREIAFAREKAKRTLPVAVLVLLALVAMYLPLPKRLVAFIPLAVALVLTVRLLRFLSARAGREKIWPAVTLAIIGVLIMTLVLQVAFYGAVRAYEDCVARAQTSLAQADCEKLRESGPLGFVMR